MNYQNIQDLLIPLLLIGFGLYIKTTNNENFKPMKKWWKTSVIFGAILFIARIIFILL